MAFQFLGSVSANGERPALRRSSSLTLQESDVDSPFDLEVDQFRKLYRLAPDEVYSIVDRISHKLEKKTISALSAEIQVRIT